MKTPRKLQDIQRDVETLYERVESLNRQIRDVLDLVRRVRFTEHRRQLDRLTRIPQEANIHFQRPDTGLVELIPTGNVIRVFRYRSRRVFGDPPIPFVRVALLREAAPLQNEDTTYAPRYLVVQYDDAVHRPRIRRALLKVFRPSRIPWVHRDGVEVLTASEPPHTHFDRLASLLHEMDYEVFIHYADPPVVEEEAAEADDEADDD